MFQARRVDVQPTGSTVLLLRTRWPAKAGTASGRLNGLFKGFIDLVFEHQAALLRGEPTSPNWSGADRQ